MAVVPYTDKDLTIRMNGKDLSQMADIHVTFTQDGLKKTDVSGVEAVSDGKGGCSLTVSLTQTQTADFVDRAPLKMDINWLNAQGKRDAIKEPVIIETGTQLLREILALPNG